MNLWTHGCPALCLRTITPENVPKPANGGRARWEIENETFNTLKNQGYNLDYSYGHGQMAKAIFHTVVDL